MFMKQITNFSFLLEGRHQFMHNIFKMKYLSWLLGRIQIDFQIFD